MILLQISSNLEQTIMKDYGGGFMLLVLGMVAIGSLFIMYIKNLITENKVNNEAYRNEVKELREEVKEQNSKFNTYLIAENDNKNNIIKENTDIIRKNIEVTESFKDLIKENLINCRNIYTGRKPFKNRNSDDGYSD